VSAEKVLFVFPGQGSQYRGMGSDLIAEFEGIGDIFDRASEAVGFDMRELCFEDPRDELGLTKYTQPALLTHEYACLEAFRGLTGGSIEPALTAGHSLGEYSALVAARALGFEDALRLVAQRGALMSELGRGGMVATTLDLEPAYGRADKHFCGIGGCNLPDQTVIAGEEADLDALVEDMAQSHPGKRAVRLNTEGAFHTYLMVAAAQRFREVLDGVEFANPACGVLSNYTGKLHEPGSQSMRSRLFFQLFNPVRWFACLNTAFDAGIDTIVEFGGGIGKTDGPERRRPNLEGIVRKSLKFASHEAEYLPAINAASIRAAASAFTDAKS
jgi:[acyl-carrier-protein] S-malonyltransferase